MGIAPLLLMPGFARDPLWLKARQIPAFDLCFDKQTIVDRISGIMPTFTRPSSTKLAWNGSTFVTYAADVPAFQYDAATGRFGYLHEPAATNRIRNNSGVGAVAGTPGTLPTNWTLGTQQGGITRSIVGTGTDNGIAYIDIRWNGTASNATTSSINFDETTQVAASSGQAWTQSLYCAVVGGSLVNVDFAQARVVERAAGGSYVAESNSTGFPVIASSLSPESRLIATRSSMGGTTQFVQGGINIRGTNGAAIDITLRIGLPQLELGTAATSPIITAGSAVTRAADTMSVTGTDFSRWYNQAGGCWYLEFTPYASASALQAIFGLDDGSTVNAVYVSRDTSDRLRSQFRTSNVVDGNILGTASEIASSALSRIAIRAELNNSAQSINGAALVTDASVGMPPVTRLTVGDAAFNVVVPQLFHRLAYFPPGPAMNRLQQLTA